MKNVIWIIVAALAFWALNTFTEVKDISLDYVPHYSMGGDRYQGGRDEMDNIFRDSEYEHGYGSLEAVSRRGRTDGGDRGYSNTLESRHRMRRSNGEYAPGHPNSRRGR